jgi:hypothetical protein
VLRRRKRPPDPEIVGENQLTTVKDNVRAADIFRRILRAVREQTEENRKKREAKSDGRAGS